MFHFAAAGFDEIVVGNENILWYPDGIILLTQGITYIHETYLGNKWENKS